MEEFQESEVLWPELHHRSSHTKTSSHSSTSMEHKSSKKRMSSTRSHPLSIPNANKVRSSLQWPENFDEEDEEEEKTVIPPHEILAKRLNGKMAFSVCIGNGRTLKGRDLSKVRNSILRLTGFLESC